MPGITFGKFQSRAELEGAVIQLVRQKETMRSIAFKCQISTRLVTRLVKKLGLTALVHPPGVRPMAPAERPETVPSLFGLVSAPCWREYCEDRNCIYHQEIGHVR